MRQLFAPEDRVNASKLLDLLDDPAALEALYRESPRAFRRAFDDAHAQRPDAILLRAWAARLSDGQRVGTAARALGPVIAIALGCGLLVRLPAVWLEPAWYYPRFAPSIVLLSVALYFWSTQRDRGQMIAGLLLAAVAGTLVLNLPGHGDVYADSVVMALIHLPILSWAFLGFVFAGASWRQTDSRIRFLRFNGELLILGSLVALGGMVFSGLTVALFALIAKGADKWYVQNIGVLAPRRCRWPPRTSTTLSSSGARASRRCLPASSRRSSSP